jgi:hypothetical protein
MSSESTTTTGASSWGAKFSQSQAYITAFPEAMEAFKGTAKVQFPQSAPLALEGLPRPNLTPVGAPAVRVAMMGKQERFEADEQKLFQQLILHLDAPLRSAVKLHPDWPTIEPARDAFKLFAVIEKLILKPPGLADHVPLQLLRTQWNHWSRAAKETVEDFLVRTSTFRELLRKVHRMHSPDWQESDDPVTLRADLDLFISAVMPICPPIEHWRVNVEDPAQLTFDNAYAKIRSLAQSAQSLQVAGAGREKKRVLEEQVESSKKHVVALTKRVASFGNGGNTKLGTPGGGGTGSRPHEGREVCRNFVHGTCFKGDKCHRIHPPPSYRDNKKADLERQLRELQEKAPPAQAAASAASITCQYCVSNGLPAEATKHEVAHCPLFHYTRMQADKQKGGAGA